MGFMEAIKACFAKYATFDGRACRSEYWYWTLFSFIVGLFLGWIHYLGTLLSILFILPGIAVSVRRLHDIGKSGWWYLLSFIPILGWLAMIYFYVLDSQSGANQYVLNPKGIGNQDSIEE